MTSYDAPVAGRDSAFMWETEVLRSARRASPRSTGEALLEKGDDWLTVREASEATGVPTSTIRKWARHDNIPSHLEKTEDGHVRIVSMRGIRRWTDEIGRYLDGDPTDEVAELDLTGQDEPTEPGIPEGTMLVPLDAWNKMLNQLGNLHEAGQQLAEARERAAKAETEAAFLRERLRELRQEKDEAAAAEQSATAAPATDDAAQPLSTTALIRKMYSDWRRNRRQ